MQSSRDELQTTISSRTLQTDSMSQQYGAYTASPSSRLSVRSMSDEQIQASIQHFGSPYARNAEWRPSRHFESGLLRLPSLGITVRIKQRFARTAGDIWNPPCPSFQRSVPESIASSLFNPIVCEGEGELASEGFQSIFPGSIMGPRDISAADWHRFLQDISVSGRLTGGQSVIANIAPLTMHMGATGYFVTKAITKGMTKRKEPVVFETVEEWNHRFFYPRGVDVFIYNCNKKDRLTATTVGGQIRALPQGLLDAKYYDSVNNSKDKKDKDKKKKKVNQVLVIAPAH